ncbi:MAG TPA: DNRLRE domain-containing protein [Anaerolineae bacterium]|nr:DNRLRE domain-containing protein [Anaerolineae bacterium]
MRRVNVPYDVPPEEGAIFWFGRVEPTENYADVRVTYNDTQLFFHIATFDRRLWYDQSPSAGDLTDWDAVTLYLDRGGNTSSEPDATAYRFEGQLVWWEARDIYQAAYQGDGGTWVPATIDFETRSGWRGDQPNNDVDDRGWWLQYLIPFESLGLDGPPLQGTVWRLGVALHDRDDSGGTPIDDKVWPEAMEAEQPATWGELAFGIPGHAAPPALPEGTTTVRHGLEGATVVDADVGGSSLCGDEAEPDFFSTWGSLNYAGQSFLNIQNQGDVADWPCFSKYYVTFPLDRIPANTTIVSATLTLFLWGGAGEGWEPEPQPSLIQVCTVGADWSEATLTWNNAPLALENISATWVYPVTAYPGRPGIPSDWDVSRAVAKAYAVGTPLRLVMYESDWAYHSGKYFDTSDTDDWGAEGRPTLKVKWGTRIATPYSVYVPLAVGAGR